MRTTRLAQTRPAILVLGCDEVGSAVARELHVVGSAIVLIDDVDPPWARRGMSYVDAWYVGGATLEGIDACFCASAKSIPAVLARGDMIAATTRSWQGVAAALRPAALVDARLSVPTDDLDAFDGFVTIAERRRVDAARSSHVSASCTGRFSTRFEIAERVIGGELVGELGGDPVIAPASGALRALSAHGARVAAGQTVLEVETSGDPHRCFGIEPSARAVAHRVAAAIRQALPEKSPASLPARWREPGVPIA